MSEDEDNMNGDEETPTEPVLKVEITNHKEDKPEKDNTSWETKDEWDIITMTEQDIKEAEESRNA